MMESKTAIKPKLIPIMVTEKEKNMIEYFREISFGVVKEIVLVNGEPERVVVEMSKKF